MSKRKRLVPPIADMSEPLETSVLTNNQRGGHPVRASAPISDIAGAASAVAALEELSQEITAARTEGRMVIRVALKAIDPAYLTRDRAHIDAEEFNSLRDSLRARGQQTPIEVVDLGQGRFGLISGLRRYYALKSLFEEAQDQTLFGHIQCLVRQPDTVADAYVAMVEENEIRADLSLYEKARIAARATEQKVFPTLKATLGALYGSVSRARRSKIKSFVPLYEHLDDVLQYPAAIPERLGLALSARVVQQPEFAKQLRSLLSEAADAASERAVLEAALRPNHRAKHVLTEACPGVALKVTRDRITLFGPSVDESLHKDLLAWLLARKPS